MSDTPDGFEADLAFSSSEEADQDVAIDVTDGARAEAPLVVPADAPSEATSSDAGDEAEELDPLEAFKQALRVQPGEWYVIHSYAGYENKVKANLLTRASSMNMEDYIYQVEVPIETVKEVKNGVIKEVKRNKFPGYVLVRMDLTDESWGTVRHTPGVTGFVGHGHNPSPLTNAEVEHILAPALEVKPAAPAGKESGGSQTVAAPAPVPVEMDIAIGDSVTIVSGAFATLHANISEINTVAQRVTVLVEIFGRETPVELGFNEIQKN